MIRPPPSCAASPASNRLLQRLVHAALPPRPLRLERVYDGPVEAQADELLRRGLLLAARASPARRQFGEGLGEGLRRRHFFRGEFGRIRHVVQIGLGVASARRRGRPRHLSAHPITPFPSPSTPPYSPQPP